MEMLKNIARDPYSKEAVQDEYERQQARERELQPEGPFMNRKQRRLQAKIDRVKRKLEACE